MANELTVEINADDSGLQDGLSSVGDSLKSIGVMAAATGAAITAGLGAAVLATTKDYESGVSKFRQQTGVTKVEMESLGDSIKNLYSKGFGESMVDVSQGMALVKQQSSILKASTTKDIEDITKYALTLQDTFEIGLDESIKTTGNLVKNFGMTGKEAMDMIAKGMQMGLNQSDDLMDTLYEYSPQFAKIGLGAKEMFNILKKGSESGIFTLDKVGDAVKEFGIRVTDGSTGTADAMKMIGLNGKEMGTAFLAGGEEGNKAFYKIIEGLSKIENPLDQNTAGVALFGTMWEDLGAKTVLSLGQMDGDLINTKGTIDEINKIKMEGITEQLTVFKRELEANILIPIGESLIPHLKDWTNNLDDVKMGLQMGGLLPASKKEMSEWSYTASETAKNTKKIANVLKTIAEVAGTALDSAGKVFDFFGLVNDEAWKVSESMPRIPYVDDFIDSIVYGEAKIKEFDFSTSGKKLGNDFGYGIMSTNPAIKNSLTTIGDTSILNRPETFGIAQRNMQNYNTGIVTEKQNTTSAINNVVSSVTGLDKSGQTYSFGTGVGNSYSSGINASKGNVVGAANNVANSFDSMKRNDSYNWGYTLISQLGQGITSGLGELKNILKRVGNTISDFFPHSPAKEGPLKTFPKVGGTLMQQLMDGMIASEDKLSMVTANIASNITSNISVNPGNTQQNNLTLPIYLDGKKISEVTAPYMVRSLRQQGF